MHIVSGRLRLKVFLSTPSARRATVGGGVLDAGVHPISIHALREEGDANGFPVDNNAFLFLSTPSARRATGLSKKRIRVDIYFYPRPPRGGRPAPRPTIANSVLFLSTPSVRRATVQSSTFSQSWQYFYPRPP